GRQVAATPTVSRATLLSSVPATSADDQPLAPLVDEQVGDERSLPRPHLAARRPIPGLQLVQLLPARRGREQGLELPFPLLQGLLRHHGRGPFCSGAVEGGGFSPAGPAGSPPSGPSPPCPP